jgi:deoxyribodipyrimidine photo-lyase
MSLARSVQNKPEEAEGIKMNEFGIHWFRRDLRIAGNGALRTQTQNLKGRVLGLFTFDDKFLSRPDFSVNRFQFFLHSLRSLRDDLRAMGGDLLVLPHGPDQAFTSLKNIFEANKIKPTAVSWSKDYEPFARERDDRIKKLLDSWGWSTVIERDHLLIEPEELSSNQGTPYKVYTPFSRRWFELFANRTFQERVAIQKPGLKLLQQLDRGEINKTFDLTWKKLLGGNTPADQLDRFIDENKKRVTVPIPEAGSLAAWRRAKAFKQKIDDYGETRDLLDQDGTSGLSVFFKNGSITIPQVIAIHGLEAQDFKSKGGASKYIRELIWREFYYHIMWHFPNAEREAFNPKYRDLAWDNDPKLFEAWKNGMTGFPVVDAAMRQLKTTGWMHNRARMIVASFMTKDLLIDWRWGEAWFMNQLLDGDLAPNNGGWQWAASTGCDAQPYFRIFNPALQSERFDTSGNYIRRYVPELRELKNAHIHCPDDDMRKKLGYPLPIVKHREQAIRAQMLFKLAGTPNE